MWRTRVALVAVVLATAQAPGWAQVTAELLSNGQSAVTVAPGPVDLTLDLRMESSIPLGTLEYTLECSQPELFEYGDPPITTGAPWSADELIVAVEEVVAGDGLSTRPDILLFKWTMPDYPAESFPSTIMTFKVRSTGDLAAGTSYTFGLGATTLPPLWIHVLEDSSMESGEIVSDVFTLTVSVGSTGGGGDAGDTGDTEDSSDETGDTTNPDSTDDSGNTGVVDVDEGGDTSVSDDGDTATVTDDQGTSDTTAEEQSTSPASQTFFCGSGTGGAALTALVGLGLLPRRRRTI